MKHKPSINLNIKEKKYIKTLNLFSLLKEMSALHFPNLHFWVTNIHCFLHHEKMLVKTESIILTVIVKYVEVND